MMKKLSFFLLLFINNLILSQLIIENSSTPQQLVENIFAGPGLTILNVTYKGASVSIGSFDGGNSNVGFNSGLILSTGNISNAIGPNNSPGISTKTFQSGDVDINTLLFPNSISYDAAVLEFDFIPVSDTVVFNYVFASEEYLTYVDQFNDVFGFFISGPGITGPFSNNSKNIALIPSTSSFVSINNINDVDYNQFYVDNGTGNNAPYNSLDTIIQYNGFTVPLQALSQVQCGQMYHLKIVIADGGDRVYDSGVFLEAASLSASKVNFSLASVTGDTVFYENCTVPEFVFTRPMNESNKTLTLDIAVSGVAIEGIDYSSISNTIFFDVGEDSVSIPFQIFSDKLSEGSESLVVTAKMLTNCGDTLEIVRSVTIYDPLQVDSLVSSPSLSCISTGSAESFVSNQIGIVNYSWSGPDSNESIVGNSASIQDLASGWYYLSVNDDYCEAKDSIFVAEPSPLQIDSLTTSVSCTTTGSAESFVSNQIGIVNYSWSGPDSNESIVGNSASIQDLASGWYYLSVNDDYCEAKDSIFVAEPSPLQIDSLTTSVSCTTTGSAESFVSNQIGIVNYSWSGPNSDESIVGNSASIQDLASGWYYLSVNDDYCEAKDSIFVAESIPPIALISSENTSGSLPLTISFTNLSQNADTYIWDFGNGEKIAVTHLDSQNYTYFMGGFYTVELIALKSQCSDTARLTIELIAEPKVYESTNVFTPNNDGTNESFTLDPTGFSSFTYKIFNRWGNIMFEGDLKNPDWNGLTQDNKPAESGTYFYIYSGFDQKNELKKGQGFFQLIR